jgi:hypothetical protein
VPPFPRLFAHLLVCEGGSADDYRVWRRLNWVQVQGSLARLLSVPTWVL